MQLAGKWGCAQVHTHHSLGAVKYAANGAPRLGRQRLDVEDEIGRQAARVIATSPQEVESLARLYPSRARTAIVPCGVSSLFRPRDQAACRIALGLPLEGPIVAYVGRFDPAKGIDTLVEAVRQLPDRHQPTVLFAGGYDPAARDSREFKRIQELVQSAGLRDQAVFLGRLEHERLALAYGAADLVVVPSHYESFGLVAVEAMGCGRPVIASEVGGLRYSVVHRETGLLVPVRDAKAFAGAITTLLDDAPLRQRMSVNAAGMVQRLFVWEAVAARLEAVYAEVARSAAGSLAWA
jgi:glycosyltransferase involved in cell wall biosynthesis